LEKLKEKLAVLSDDEEETKKPTKKNLFEIGEVQKSKKNNKKREIYWINNITTQTLLYLCFIQETQNKEIESQKGNSQKQSKFFGSNEPSQEAPKNITKKHSIFIF